jgi:ElaB/YqjD/DUF883 family membrane-anchored ribosome-binding protein
MDQPKRWEAAKDAAEQAGKTANETVQRVGAQVQPALDHGKAAVQDLANRASAAGRQAVDQAGELIEGVAPQVREAASNLYDQGSRSGERVRQYVAQEPLASMLIAGLIGYGLAYLIHRR